MALALLFQDDTVMFIDAVTNYSKSRSSNITSNPVDAASNVTDHVSKNNPYFTIRGIISSADFHSVDQRDPTLLNSTEFKIDNEFRSPVDEAIIKERSNLLDFLPGSIQQFLSSTNPSTVSMDDFRGYSHEAARNKLTRADQKSERLTLLDYDYDFYTGRSVSVKSFQNVIIERYDDNETVDTGDSLEFTLSLKQIRLVYIKEVDVQINRNPAPSVANKAAAENNKGDQSTTEGEQSKYFADFVESSEGLNISNLTDYIPGF